MVKGTKVKILQPGKLEERLQTQLAYRFGSHSEKSFEQLSLFDDLDDDFPEAEILSSIFELAADTTDWTDSKL